MTVPHYRRILVKLSGEALLGGDSYGIAPETVFGLLPIASACLILAWAVAAVVVRRRTREEEQFDRDRMYPPAEYWEAQDGD